MKKAITSAFLISSTLLLAQFSVKVSADKDFLATEAYFYTLNGSKDVLASKVLRKDNSWILKYPKNYVGMMKVYFPTSNISFSFISENSDVDISVASQPNMANEVRYNDRSNKLMDDIQSQERKKQVILPALAQMKTYYKSSEPFYSAMESEIFAIKNFNSVVDQDAHPFISYYLENYKKYLSEGRKLDAEEVVRFIAGSNNMLETSTLLQPILTAYIQGSGANTAAAIDKLLNDVIIESPRGQIVLSEIIDILDSFGTTALKDKYLGLAKNLKCVITDRLASTIAANQNTALGAKFPNLSFISASNTKATSLYDVKAKNKVILFWASTCPHCENQLPLLIEHYAKMKENGIEVIGLSLDTDRKSYEGRTKDLPWINDSELKGWYSSYVDQYNIHATPTFFILDAENKIVSKPDSANEVFEFLKLK